jgi:hypothetical protein
VDVQISEVDAKHAPVILDHGILNAGRSSNDELSTRLFL